jgi:MFS family permease
MHTRIAMALGVGWMLDAFEVQIIGSVVPGIQAEFGLGGAEAVLINVVWFVGIALGALGFGYLADRVGRKKLFVATLVMYSVAAVLTAAAPTFEVFMLFRFITALGVGGEYSAITSAIAEFTPKARRGLSNGLVMTFWALGGILASVVSIVVISSLGLTWRYTLLFGVVSAAYGLLARRLIPESPRWLASRGRRAEADSVVESITGVRSEAGYVLPPGGAPDGRSALGRLWRDYRPRLLLGMALPYVFLVANVGALLGGVVVSFGLDRLGRRPTVTFSYAAAAGSMLVCAAAATTGSEALVVAAFTGAAFFATRAWVSAYPTFSELFPTGLRATGIGASVAVGRAGAIIGQVLLAQVALSFSLGAMFALLAAFWMIGSVAGVVWWVLGTEANGVSLEDLVAGARQSGPEPSRPTEPVG